MPFVCIVCCSIASAVSLTLDAISLTELLLLTMLSVSTSAFSLALSNFSDSAPDIWMISSATRAAASICDLMASVSSTWCLACRSTAIHITTPKEMANTICTTDSLRVPGYFTKWSMPEITFSAPIAIALMRASLISRYNITVSIIKYINA